MKKELKQLISDIKAKRAPEENLPELMNRAASAYGMLSLHNLTMELSVYLESKEEGRIHPEERTGDMEERLFAMLHKTLVQPFDPAVYEETILGVSALREEVTEKMDVLTAYTDLFILYEYMLNRLEAVFEPGEAPVMDNDAVAREILQWIFSAEEPGMVNSNIKDMLACLPVRMTKAKFYELIENAFSVYKDSDRRSVDMFDYMLRSAAGIHKTETEENGYEDLKTVKTLFEGKDWAALTKEEYDKCKMMLMQGTEFIQDITECLSSLQEIANAFLTVLLTRQYFTLTAEKEAEKPLVSLKLLVNREEIHAETLFEGVEEEIEPLRSAVSVLETLLLDVKEQQEKQITELMLSTIFQRLLLVQKLNSGSLYVSLQEEELPEEAEYTTKIRDAFLTDIKTVLEQGSRVRNRAVMAEVLKELPVYFNNHTEVMNYVRNSLDGCKDEREKQICVELLRSCYY